MFAVVELSHILLDAVREALRAAVNAADLPGRLSAWWWVVSHRHLLSGPPPAKEAAGGA